VRLDIRRIGSIKDGQEVIGNRTRVRVVKNKVAPPFKEAQFDIMYGEGISATGDLLDIAVQMDIVEKGRENVKTFLKENKDIFDRIMDKTRDALGMAKKKQEDTESGQEGEKKAGKK